LPIPAAPSSTSTAKRFPIASRNFSASESSRSRPTTPTTVQTLVHPAAEVKVDQTKIGSPDSMQR
jgi:hypothetical protein